MTLLQSLVTPLTHNIPSFLRTPAEGIIGEKCYQVLVYDFDVTHGECLKYAMSKGLGLGIVVGGGIVKIPQIMTILRTGSTRGLSLSAYILETISYGVSLAYASRNHFPFSTYGENFFITIQNVLITLLILYLSGPTRGAPLTSGGSVRASAGGDLRSVLVGGVVTALSGVFLWSEALCPLSLLSLLQAATLPISLLSKAPQIISNHRAKSTGNLSAFAVFNALLGCLARLFTTMQEVKDPLIFWGYAGATILNLVLVIQVIMYWRAESDLDRSKRGSGVNLAEDGKNGLGSPGGLSGGGEKRWARKLD